MMKEDLIIVKEKSSMKLFVLTACLIIYGFSTYAQELNSETNSLLRTVFEKSKSGDLFPELGGLRYFWIKKNLAAKYFVQTTTGKARPDTLLLSDKERAFIDSSLAAANSFRWTKEAAKEAGLNMGVVMLGIQRQGDPLTYAIMKPILIRNNTFSFLFYSSFTKQQGYHNLSIWKRSHGKWVLWRLVAERKI
jgi:hypothetical protein